MNISQLKIICGQSEFWPHFYPRMYRHAEQFGDPRVPAYALTILAEGVKNNLTDHRTTIAAMTKLASLKMPTMFIDRGFADAAALSLPPPDLRWAEIKLPHEAALLMLPRNWLQHPKYGECHFIGYARYENGARINLPGGHREITFESDTFNIFSAFPTDGEFPTVQRSFVADKQPTLESLIYTPEQMLFVSDPQTPFELYSSASEFEFMEQATWILFSIVLAITARPGQLIRHGRRAGRHKTSGLPIWTPNIIGRDYRYNIRSEPSEPAIIGTFPLAERRSAGKPQT